MTTALNVDDMILQIDASGVPVRFEYVRGRMKWEMSPASRHQMTIRHIERSVRPTQRSADCDCFALADVLIRFPDPDQSLKRPDITIFCTPPPAIDEALTMIPMAVVEVVSLGYEEKDIGPDGAPFYLAYGVQAVRDYLARCNHAHPRADWPITCIQFAPHASEQNPIEDVWLQAKTYIRNQWQRLDGTFQTVKDLFEEAIMTLTIDFPKLHMYTAHVQLK